MNGSDYIANVRLSNADDETLALPGETCVRVPVESLGWLIAQQLIEPTPRPLPPESVTPREGDD